MAENIIIDTADLSLLYPSDEHKAEAERKRQTGLSEYTAEQLELYSLIEVNGCSLGDFFTDDAEVILYRQETFSDIEKNPEICAIIKKIIPLLGDITELRRMSSDPEYSAESYLYSITEVELYISLLSQLREGFSMIKDNLTSRAFKHLYEIIEKLTESDYYRDINRQLEALTSRVREVKSVTIGVNLDSRLKVESAGVLSINNDKFKSGQLIDRVLRLDFKAGEMTCIAPLTPFRKDQSENQQLALSYALSSALGDVLRSSLRSWKKVIRSYVLDNTDFLIRMLPEFEFVLKAAEMIHSLKENECPLTYPQIAERSELMFEAESLCNPVVSMKLGEKVVPNSFTFDRDGMIFVLTGPNRGGKSVITCAVGCAFAMAGLGLPVCAESCRISLADKIFTHFPQGSEDTIDKGRLGEECARLEKILDSVTQNSLVLMDESFSSTGAYEASAIAGEVLCGLSVIGCRGIFSTHLHELAATTAEINTRCNAEGGVKIDNLVAELAGDKRSFKILRKSPDGKSHAADIAKKYGLSFDIIKEKAKQLKGNE